MTECRTYKALDKKQIEMLIAQNCSAENWDTVLVTDSFDPSRVRNAHFSGEIKIAGTSGHITINGIEKPCGIYNAYLVNTTIGNNCRIANIKVHIANYLIEDNACIEDVGTMQTNNNATFGNGIEVNAINEAGGREVTIFNELTSQFAYLMCLHRYRPELIAKLKTIASKCAGSVRSDTGRIGQGVSIRSVDEIIDVNIGEYANVTGATTLANGTILSSKDAPAIIGADVCAKDFIIAESSEVTEAAIIEKVFVGQGSIIGKQFTAEHSLFFANCQALAGEACAIFAGPYTVTHHKSSLLIAGLFSFFNAGSGTNQSNHMYKSGPVQEGKTLRGCKTGSFAYMLWPSAIGPFSVVLGKHNTNLQLSDLPFSRITSRPDGKSELNPARCIATVATVRDHEKWLTRDIRKGKIKRDKITARTFSPYTISKMLKAIDTLEKLEQKRDNSYEVTIGGAIMPTSRIAKSLKAYRDTVAMYLAEKIIDKFSGKTTGKFSEKIIDKFPEKTIGKFPAKLVGKLTGKVIDKLTESNRQVDLKTIFATDDDAVFSDEWVDIAGMLMPQTRLKALHESIENSAIDSMQGFNDEIDKIDESFDIDEWAWVKQTCAAFFNIDLDNATSDDITKIADILLYTKSKFIEIVIANAATEFSDRSAIGFGQDGGDEDATEDFQQVRGNLQDKDFIKKLNAELEVLKQKVESAQNSLK